jgi:hypothetical protein
MKRILYPSLFFALIISALLLGSCGTENGDPFVQAKFNAWDNDLNKRVEAYFDATQSNPVNVTAGSPRVYIDFSNGLVQAYTSNPDNANMLDKITQKLTGSDIKWFGMGHGQIYPLNYNYSTTKLYNKVTDPNSFATDIMAPIEETVKEITKSNSDALLITDFEEYTTDGKEQFENFAKGYAIDWLSNGNSIDIFITNYEEKTKDKRKVSKHLFFVVFNYGPAKKLLGDINYALKERGYKYETFSLSTDFYTLSTEYGEEKKGGNYYDQKGQDIVGSMDDTKYVNGLAKSGKMYEFYAFRQPWKDIFANAKSLMEEGVPLPFTDFFRKLYLDASKDDVFQLKGLEVKVYDITDDFLFFSKTQEVKSHKPMLTKDANGNSILDPNQKDPIALGCYDTQGNILEAWIYKPNDKIILNEIFVLNSELYNNGFKDNKDKIELGTKFHGNFNGSQIMNPNGLYRVDIQIADCNPNFDKLNLFKWESTTVKGRYNESLAEAIRNTLDKVNPKGKVIYSYFIKAADI